MGLCRTEEESSLSMSSFVITVYHTCGISGAKGRGEGSMIFLDDVNLYFAISFIYGRTYSTSFQVIKDL